MTSKASAKKKGSARAAPATTPVASLTRAFDFAALVGSIQAVHDTCASHASRAVNASLTVRNWLIGATVVAYQLRGKDRADYGEALIAALAERLTRAGLKGCQARDLYRHIALAQAYPEILGTLSPQWARLVPGPAKGLRAPSRKKVGTLSPLSKVPRAELLERLSYSHFVELLDVESELGRDFYEVECLRGNWSVRELSRQIGALYFERSGLSKRPDKLAAMVDTNAEHADPKLLVRDPYVFEFLGLKSKEVFSESDLEDALLDRLQDFLLELGHGFCFEARQKRIALGDHPGFVDLVFYHRVLKCHVLLELKVSAFKHEHVGQLNTYVSYYKRNMMSEGDNPPIGLLLCTKKDETVVEYALADLPNRLFVSKYQVELPTREKVREFLEKQMREVGSG